jgi:hypothetical protein
VKHLAHTSKQIVLACLLTLLLDQAAHAATWYLMAADVKVISQPKAANMMSKGAVVGPIHFASQGSYPSRDQCESARQKLLDDWRQYSIPARGGWNRYGFHTPNSFAQCVSSADPRVSKGEVPTMDITLPKKRIGRRSL